MTERTAQLALAVTARTTFQARAQLRVERARVTGQLKRLEERLVTAGPWGEVLRLHPFLAVGGALTAGFLLGRWSDLEDRSS